MSNSNINQDLIESEDDGTYGIISGSIKLSNIYKRNRQSSLKKLLLPINGSKSEKFMKVDPLISRTVDNL